MGQRHSVTDHRVIDHRVIGHRIPMLDIRKRTGWIFFGAMLAQILLVSAQVQTKSGARALNAVTFEVFSRVEHSTSSAVKGGQGFWGNYIGLRGVKAENDVLRRR